MKIYNKNSYVKSDILPVDIVFHPSWWHRHTGITFDEDFYYHPDKRVETERKMEKELYERFGQFGLGADWEKDIPVIGAVHNAAGYFLSEMLGCKVMYQPDSSPLVIPLGQDKLSVCVEDAFASPVFIKFLALKEKLKTKYGYILGDINWGGILNIALDLVGEKVFIDFFTNPEETKKQFFQLSKLIEKFVSGIFGETGTSSISVNRNVRHIEKPVFLHSECSHTMIATDQYEEFLLPFDQEWSRKFRPFGIHYCGNDPHRYAEVFAKIPNLDFLDLGWGGNVRKLREYLPNTFLNLRLDPVTINDYTDNELEIIITRLVEDSANPHLTGVCCINMDDKVEDEKVNTILRVVAHLRQKYYTGAV